MQRLSPWKYVFFFVLIYNCAASQAITTEELAKALISAKNSQERDQIISSHEASLTADLENVLKLEADKIRAKGDLPRALEIYQVIQRIAEQIKDKPGLADALTGIGEVYLSQGNSIVAMEYFQKSLVIGEELKDKAIIGTSLRMIGRCEYYLGNNNDALDYFKRSLATFEEIQDKNGIGKALNTIGIIYMELGNYRLALDYYEESLAIHKEMNNKIEMARCLNNIAIVYDSQGNSEQALNYYRRSLTLFEEARERAQVANVLNNMGDPRLLGSNEKALEYNLKSLKIAEEVGDKRLMARALGNAGNAYRWMGDFEKALEYNSRALNLSEQLGYKDDAVSQMKNVATVYFLKGEYEKALPFIEQAISQAESTDVITYVVSLTVAGRIHKALNHFDQARGFFEKAIMEIEGVRNNLAGGEQETSRFFEERVITPYIEIVDLLIAENKIEEALAYAERAKARVLMDVLRYGKVNITRSMTKEELDQEESLKKQLVALNSDLYKEKQNSAPDPMRLADLESRLQKARLDHEAFRVSLYSAHPELKVQRGEIPPATRDELAALIDDSRTVFLEYTIMKEKLHIFVMTKSSLVAHSVKINQKDLAELVQRFRQQLADRHQGFRKLSKELSTLLLSPAQKDLKNHANLVIIPDDILWELPFQALVTQENHYLVEQHALSYAPSLTVLLETSGLQKNSKKNKGLLAFGNPALEEKTIDRVKFAYEGHELLSLPEAEREVKALGKLYGSESRIYIRADATEDRLKTEARNYGVLHLATHGILDDHNPMYSHIVLSQSANNSKEDGLLEAWEIIPMDLRANLAVLSSCETARGRIGSGEGIIGLSWALFVAGIPTTVVSQWKVDSASTTQLMLAFHKFRKQKQVSTAEALQSAAKELLGSASYRHPFYWAGFVAIGSAF